MKLIQLRTDECTSMELAEGGPLALDRGVWKPFSQHVTPFLEAPWTSLLLNR
jgi:hypothetical protein